MLKLRRSGTDPESYNAEYASFDPRVLRLYEADKLEEDDRSGARSMQVMKSMPRKYKSRVKRRLGRTSNLW
jgi:hypothetical protein